MMTTGSVRGKFETLIVPRAVDLGGFEVRRALPTEQRQMVGPFIFFDHFGPVDVPAGKGADVRPHSPSKRYVMVASPIWGRSARGVEIRRPPTRRRSLLEPACRSYGR
jgi:hypothetical protein